MRIVYALYINCCLASSDKYVSLDMIMTRTSLHQIGYKKRDAWCKIIHQIGYKKKRCLV